MLPGYNHNICYKGQIFFYIQTEDSGRDHPQTSLLLFVKGNIVQRKKKEYGDIIGFAPAGGRGPRVDGDQHGRAAARPEERRA
ncbi:MAG: hypothetical protein MZU95_15935 [Desulfomicrobium escambiense]|nr:hypothetical protein [Desulfomicrobium escambiense]